MDYREIFYSLLHKIPMSDSNFAALSNAATEWVIDERRKQGEYLDSLLNPKESELPASFSGIVKQNIATHQQLTEKAA